jgi:hypothetical protein
MRSTARFYPAFTFLQIPFWLWKWDKSVSLHSFGIPLIWIACPPCTSKHHFGDVAYKTTISQIHNTVCLWDKDGGLFTSPDLIKNAARWLVGYFSLIDVSEPSILGLLMCTLLFQKLTKKEKGLWFAYKGTTQLHVRCCFSKDFCYKCDWASLLSCKWKPITRYQFSAVLRKVLISDGIQSDNFKSHSFRIGTASEASVNGISDSKIMELGRWKSQAVKNYLRLWTVLTDN